MRVLSRCQQYNFRRITAGTIARRLQELLQEEGVEAEDAAVRYIARAGDGSLRDALSLLDQCIAFYLGEKLTYGKVLNVLGTVDTDVFSSLLRKVIAQDAAGSVRILQELIRDGREVSQFVTDFTWYLRNLMLVQSSPDLEDTLDVSPENLLQLQEESNLVDSGTLMRYIHVLSELSGQLRFATQKQILVEVALIRLCRPQMDEDLSGILDRIRTLEEKIENGLPAYVPQPAERPAAERPDGPVQQAEKPPARKAAPEDLQRIASCWPQILKRVGSPGRAVWQQAGVPRYDTDTGAARLYLEIGNPTFREMLSGPEELDILKKAIAETVGQDLDYEIQIVGAGHGMRLDAVPQLDERLAQEIAVPIEEI